MNLVRALLVAFGSCFLQVAWCDTLGDTQAGNLRGPQANSTAVVPVPQRILSSSHRSSIHERDLFTGPDYPSWDSRDYGSKWDRTHHLEPSENVIVEQSYYYHNGHEGVSKSGHGDGSGNGKKQQFFYGRPTTGENLVTQATQKRSQSAKSARPCKDLQSKGLCKKFCPCTGRLLRICKMTKNEQGKIDPNTIFKCVGRMYVRSSGNRGWHTHHICVRIFSWVLRLLRWMKIEQSMCKLWDRLHFKLAQI